MIQVPLSELFDFLQKSKIKAGSGRDTGKYPFFTSSEKQSKFLDDYEYDPPCLIFGTGGNASVHLAITGFSTSTDCLVMTPRERVAVDPNYTYRFLAGNIQLLQAGFKGAGLKHISKKYIADIRIPLPPLAEQKRIAKILDAADALRAKRRETLAQLDTLLQSTFLDIFGDPVTNPMGWEVVLLGDVLAVKGGFAFKSSDYITNSLGTPLIRIGEVNRCDFVSKNLAQLPLSFLEQYERFVVKNGAILMSMTGTVGKDDYGNAITLKSDSDKYLLNQRVAELIPSKEINSVYLHCVLSNEKVKGKLTGRSRGVRQANISNGDIKQLQVTLPPLDLQRRFAAIVESVERQKTRMRAHLTELDALFASLQSRAFSGTL